MKRSLKTALTGAALLAGLAYPMASEATPALHGLKPTGTTEATRILQFDVFLPLQHKDKLEALLKAQQDPKSPQYHHWLTPAQFGAQFGPGKGALAKAAALLRS